MKIISLVMVLNLFFLWINQEKESYVDITQDTALQQSIKRGKEIYVDMCNVTKNKKTIKRTFSIFWFIYHLA